MLQTFWNRCVAFKCTKPVQGNFGRYSHLMWTRQGFQWQIYNNPFWSSGENRWNAPPFLCMSGSVSRPLISLTSHVCQFIAIKPITQYQTVSVDTLQGWHLAKKWSIWVLVNTGYNQLKLFNTGHYWSIENSLVNIGFSSPELKPASVCLSVNFYMFDFFSRTTGPILTRLGTNHPRAKGIQVCSNEWDCPSPKGDTCTNKRVKIHWKFLEIFFSRTSRPKSIKLGTNYPWVKRI